MTAGVIISGGQAEENFVLRFLQEQGIFCEENKTSEPAPLQQLIAADAGLELCSRHGIVPAHIVGDFDSSGTEILLPYRSLPGVTIRQYRPEKDYTDTEIAVDLACSLGWDHVTILRGTGSRLDHVLGNIQVLNQALIKGTEAVLLDPHNRITIHNSSFKLQRKKQWGKYVSFFALGPAVTDLNLQGFAYPLTGHTLGSVGSLAVSNEIVDDEACVTFSSGTLLCIEARD